MDPQNIDIIESTRRQALYLWVGLSLSLSLFFVQSQMFFIKAKPLPTSGLEWVFIGLGIVTFALGYFFFKYYTQLRKEGLMKLPLNDRKQSLLIAFVMQFVLFESLGLYGVVISVITQNTLKAVPFVIFAYLGFYLAFPKRNKIAPFF